jgi:hypothetical protein
MRRKRGKKPGLILTVLMAIAALGWWFLQQSPEFVIAGLADPMELRELGERGANPRLNQIVYWLHEVEHAGDDPTKVLAVALARVYGSAAQRELVQAGLLRNLNIAHRLGLLTPEHGNLEQLKQGRSPTITMGPYAGEKTEVDHILPRSLAPELDNELANLELTPASLNRQKSNRVNERHLSVAEQFYQAGLLTAESRERVRAQARLNPSTVATP